MLQRVSKASSRLHLTQARNRLGCIRDAGFPFGLRATLQTPMRPPYSWIASSGQYVDCRAFSSDAASTSSSKVTETELPENFFAKGQPEDLAYRLSKLTNWSALPARKSISRRFEFHTFDQAWEFMCLVANEIKAKNHHPRWQNRYTTVAIEWTTHIPRGVSLSDIEMAEFCDRAGDKVGVKSSLPKA